MTWYILLAPLVVTVLGVLVYHWSRAMDTLWHYGQRQSHRTDKLTAFVEMGLITVALVLIAGVGIAWFIKLAFGI